MKRLPMGAGVAAVVLSTSIWCIACGATLPRPGTPRRYDSWCRIRTRSRRSMQRSLGRSANPPTERSGFIRVSPAAATRLRSVSMETRCRSGRSSSLVTRNAPMWLPALDPVAKAKGDRLVVLWSSSCPMVALSGISYDDNGKIVPEKPICGWWRTAEIEVIHAQIFTLTLSSSASGPPAPFTHTAASRSAKRSGGQGLTSAVADRNEDNACRCHRGRDVLRQRGTHVPRGLPILHPAEMRSAEPELGVPRPAGGRGCSDEGDGQRSSPRCLGLARRRARR